VKVIYMGSGDIGLPSLRCLLEEREVDVLAVVTQPDRPAGRGMTVRPSRIKELALQHGVEVLQPEKVRETGTVALLASLVPDILVVMAYGQILPQSLLDVPRLGAINLHASLLPRHRGAAPIHAALLAGDHVSGITAMWMNAGLDTGDILLQRECEVTDEDTAETLHDRLAALAPEALSAALALVRAGRAPRIKQDDSAASYAPKMDRSLGRIDWHESAEAIALRIRALHPWPGCSAEMITDDGRRTTLKILRASAETGTAPAGELREGMMVGCGGGGLLRILQLQAPGRKAMEAEAFLLGHRVRNFSIAVAESRQQAVQQQQ